MPSSGDKTGTWKNRKRGGRHGSNGNAGKRGGGNNKNKRLFYRKRSLHESFLSMHSVFSNPYLVNVIGTYLSFTNYAALRSVYRLTNVKNFLYHPQLVMNHVWEVSNTSEKFCVPWKDKNGCSTPCFTIKVVDIRSIASALHMVMFGVRIFHPDRNLWMDMGVNHRGDVYLNTEKVSTLLDVGLQICSNDMLQYKTMKIDGDLCVTVSVNDGVPQSMGSCRMLRRYPISELIFFVLVYAYPHTPNERYTKCTCYFMMS